MDLDKNNSTSSVGITGSNASTFSWSITADVAIALLNALLDIHSIFHKETFSPQTSLHINSS